MSDYTTTPNLHLYKPNPGADVDTWGNHLNSNADTLDATFGAGFLPLSGGALTGPLTVGGALRTTGANFIQAGDSSGANNLVRINPSAPGVNPNISMFGPDTDRDLVVFPLGTGSLASGRVYAGRNAPVAYSSTPVPVFRSIASTVTGTLATANASAHNQMTIGLDQVDASAIHDGLQGLQILHNFGNGAATKGSRVGLQVYTNLMAGAQSGNKAAGINPFYGVANLFLTLANTEGGTAPTQTAGNGRAFILNPQLTALPSATNWMDFNLCEWNIGVQMGASVSRKFMMTFVPQSGDQVQGTQEDAVVKFGGSPGTIGFRTLILFGGGFSEWIGKGALIRGELTTISGAPASTSGLDLAQIAFPARSTSDATKGFLSSNAFSVDGIGSIQTGTAYLTPGAGGLAVDVKGITGTGTPTVSAGGSGYLVGDYLFDAWGGIYKVATLAGTAVATVSVYTDANGNTRQPYYPAGTPPANPVTTTPWRMNYLASGCTLTLAWDTSRRALQIQPTAGGTLGFYGSAPVAKQTGVAVTAAGIHAALTSLGLIAP